MLLPISDGSCHVTDPSVTDKATTGRSAEFVSTLDANLRERGRIRDILPDLPRKGEYTLPVEPPGSDRRQPPMQGRPATPPVTRPAYPEPEPGTAGFEEVEQEAAKLRAAVEELIRQEERLAQQEIEQQNRDNPGIVATVRTQADEGSRLLRQAIDLSLDALDAYLDNVLRPHAEVPGRLEREGEELRERGVATQEIADEAGELLAESWEGEAADAYAEAATVQHKALQELAGVMLSGGAALRRSGELNSATFFVVAERLRMACRRIESLSGRRGLFAGQLFSRLRSAASQLRRLLSDVQDMVTEVQEGDSASELAAELDTLADLPNLLDSLTWPSGVERADREPADTENAII